MWYALVIIIIINIITTAVDLLHVMVPRARYGRIHTSSTTAYICRSGSARPRSLDRGARSNNARRNGRVRPPVRSAAIVDVTSAPHILHISVSPAAALTQWASERTLLPASARVRAALWPCTTKFRCVFSSLQSTDTRTIRVPTSTRYGY